MRVVKKLILGSLVLSLVCSGCKKNHPSTNSHASPGAESARAKVTVPLDHLAPGELRAGNELAFGFPIPIGMTIERAFPDAVHLVGDVDVQGLVRYVRSNAQTNVLELRGSSLVFDSVRIPAAGSDRRFRIEIFGRGHPAQLLIKEETASAQPSEPHLTDEERWRRAGMKPNGDPLDVSQLR